jgi:hypothetical protein
MLTFSRSPATAVFLGGPNRADLDKICALLNSARYPKKRDDLRQLVRRWRESGPNLEQMLDSDPILAKEMQSAWHAKLYPGKHARAQLALNPTKLSYTESEYAAGMFAALTLNPECEKLGGPCAYVPCSKYFIRSGSRLTSYCSRRCCQLASAIRYTKRRLDKEREEKLGRVKTAMQRWRKAHTQDDWKTSVCRQEPDITMKFLTRAVTKGDIVPPKSK